MIKEVSVKPLLDIEALLKKNFKLIRNKEFSNSTVEVLKSLFEISRILDAFFYEITPLEYYHEEAVSLSADKAVTDNVVNELEKALQVHKQTLEQSDESFPPSFHRNISKIEAILDIYKELNILNRAPF